MLAALFYTSAGICLFAAIFSGFVALLKDKSNIFLNFSCICLCIAGYQIFSLHYFQADQLSPAIELLRWQVFCVLFMTPSFYAFIAAYTGAKKQRALLLAIGIICCFFAYLNFTQPLTIRFSQVTELIQVPLPWPGHISIIKGELALWGKFIHGLYWLLLCWVGYRSWRLYQKKELRVAIFFSVYLAIQIVTVMVGLMIDIGMVHFFYVTGFSFVILIMLMCFSLAIDFKNTNHRILAQTIKLTTERRQRLMAQKNLNMMAQVVDQSPSAMMILDLSGRVIETNQACDDFWQRSLVLEKVNFLDFLCLLYPTKSHLIKEISQQEKIQLPPIYMNEVSTPYFAASRKKSILTFRLFITREYNQAKQIVVSCSDVTSSQQQMQAIRHIASGVTTGEGGHVYHDLITNLVKLFKAKYGFIGFIQPQDPQVIRTCSVVGAGKIMGNFTYSLVHSPCTHLTKTNICHFPQHAKKLFPQDDLISKMDVESYICTKIVDEEGQTKGYIVLMHTEPLHDDAQLRDILDIFSTRAGTEMQRNEAQNKIRKMAYEDYLTHLPNRALLLEHLTEQITQHKSNQTLGLMVVMDLDHFKSINDVLGHDIGDNILRCIAKLLSEHCLHDFFIARQGGDEFALISRKPCLHLAQLTEAMFKLEKLLNQPLQVGEHKIDLGASFGVCQFPTTNESALDVIRHAELALYKAKSSGRGRYKIYEHSLETIAQERMEMQQALKHAIANEELSLYFQPQLDSQGQLFGTEVLLRWFSPRFGFVSPAKFIPLAEETGLIHKIGEWVFTSALSSLRQWQTNSIPFQGHLSVNVSAWQFALPHFAEDVINKVKAQEISPHNLMLEVTETGLLVDIPDTIQKLSLIRQFGIEIALDDFGTGYSSMAYLKELPLDLLKIDKTFIDELAQHDHSPITESIISIGKNMQLKVIAEGVETLDQAKRLADLGCHIYQGYYFAKPMPEQDFIAWLFKHGEKQLQANSTPQHLNRA
ncbi:EAL domain-containing protein [Motilimonas eburnea]|uniref:EAL domain-containing protein n=1 Tax=Motilimonas eburnea TaxID=1737488 RepID=UPI001E5264B8|nr:EAL domain-containing protein [Motilimonas eburnea]MCE2571309.1 bifunctional diguanylate cyclase/phosphodiesterase [Motilimonas eburnea]